MGDCWDDSVDGACVCGCAGCVQAGERGGVVGAESQTGTRGRSRFCNPTSCGPDDEVAVGRRQCGDGSEVGVERLVGCGKVRDVGGYQAAKRGVGCRTGSGSGEHQVSGLCVEAERLPGNTQQRVRVGCQRHIR